MALSISGVASVDDGKGRLSDINGIEGFWGFDKSCFIRFWGYELFVLLPSTEEMRVLFRLSGQG